MIVVSLPPQAVAQTIEGKVVVVDIVEPIPGAIVMLVRVDGGPENATVSDSAGRFSVDASGPGYYVLRVSALGFATATSDPIATGTGQTIGVRVNLRRTAVVLEGITIFGRTAYSGFHERRTLEDEYKDFRYRWFDTRKMREHHVHSVGGVLGNVPLCRRRCFSLWVDGKHIRRSDWQFRWILGDFPVDWIYGVEVFRNRGDASREFKRWGSAHCGVVLVWTRPVGPHRNR